MGGKDDQEINVAVNCCPLHGPGCELNTKLSRVWRTRTEVEVEELKGAGG